MNQESHLHSPPFGHHHPAGGGFGYNRAFAIGVSLNLAFVAVEAACGIAAQSLVLLADAGHNFSDVLGLLLAWAASALALRRPTPRRTYGLGSKSAQRGIVNGLPEGRQLERQCFTVQS
jgi:cobalt-zinc-cadmium efflux system protein